jgi:hypothetical protein
VIWRAWVKADGSGGVSGRSGGMVQPVGKNCTVLMVRSELVERRSRLGSGSGAWRGPMYQPSTP